MRERQKFGHIRRTKRFALSLRSKIRTGALAVLAQLACWMVNSHRGTGKMAKVWNWCVISRFSRSTFTILVRLQRRRKYSQGDLKSSRVFGETQRLKSIKRWKQKKETEGRRRKERQCRPQEWIYLLSLIFLRLSLTWYLETHFESFGRSREKKSPWTCWKRQRSRYQFFTAAKELLLSLLRIIRVSMLGKFTFISFLSRLILHFHIILSC